MAKTSIEDVFVPEVWEQYFIERTAELNKFGMSGIIGQDPQFNAIAAGPGTTANMPFWTDISGARQIISDTGAFTPKKITSSKDVCRIQNDGDSWSTTLLADLLAGSSGMDAIVQLVGEYWARIDEAMLVATINGVLAALDLEAGDPNLLKIASESIGGTDSTSILNGITFIDAKQKLGDQKDRLTAVAMHSAVEADLMKQDLIDFIPDSEGKSTLPTFQGLRVVVDDSLPSRAGVTTGTVYTTVLFGQGAIAQGNAPLTKPVEGGFGTEGVERTRVPLNHDSIMINRRRYILHPRGIRWNEANCDADGGPTDLELADKDNWTRVYESKNVRLVGVVHNLNSQIPASS